MVDFGCDTNYFGDRLSVNSFIFNKSQHEHSFCYRENHIKLKETVFLNGFALAMSEGCVQRTTLEKSLFVEKVPCFVCLGGYHPDITGLNRTVAEVMQKSQSQL